MIIKQEYQKLYQQTALTFKQTKRGRHCRPQFYV